MLVFIPLTGELHLIPIPLRRAEKFTEFRGEGEHHSGTSSNPGPDKQQFRDYAIINRDWLAARSVVQFSRCTYLLFATQKEGAEFSALGRRLKAKGRVPAGTGRSDVRIPVPGADSWCRW